MLAAAQERDGNHLVQGVLAQEFHDAHGEEIGPGQQGHLLLPVIDVDHFPGIVQVDGAFFRADVVDEVLVLADVPDKAVVLEFLPNRRTSSCSAERHT